MPANSESSLNQWPIEPDSPLFVAKAIITTTTAGAITGGVLGAVRAGNPVAYSVNMGINGGVFGLTFFGLREYLISPLLISSQLTASHAARFSSLSAKQLGKLPANYSPSLSDVRTDRLLDSSISGFLTGSTLSGSLRGVRTVVPAGITAGLVAGLVQYSVNEVRVVRLQLLARGSRAAEAEGGDAAGTSGMGPAVGAQTAPDLPTGSTTAIAQTTAARAVHGQDSPAQPTKQAFDQPLQHDTSTQTLPARMMSGLSRFLPVRKLSDDEYMATLEKRRGEIDKRLGEIEKEEVRFYEASIAQDRT